MPHVSFIGNEEQRLVKRLQEGDKTAASEFYARYGGSLRNLIIDVKRKLSELEIHNFFITEYNSFRINPEAVKCDYYDFLAGDTKAIKSFTGEFMSQYSWSEEAVGFLERKVLK